MKPFATYLVILGSLSAASPASGNASHSSAVTTFDLTPDFAKQVPFISIRKSKDTTLIDCRTDGPVPSVAKFYDIQGRLIGTSHFIAHKDSTILTPGELQNAAVMRIQLLQ
jgi:hypothetical protein